MRKEGTVSEIERGWVIENSGFYWCAGEGYGGHLDAVRFCRREDAEKTARWLRLSPGYRVVEHAWYR